MVCGNCHLFEPRTEDVYCGWCGVQRLAPPPPGPLASVTAQPSGSTTTTCASPPVAGKDDETHAAIRAEQEHGDPPGRSQTQEAMLAAPESTSLPIVRRYTRPARHADAGVAVDGRRTPAPRPTVPPETAREGESRSETSAYPTRARRQGHRAIAVGAVVVLVLGIALVQWRRSRGEPGPPLASDTGAFALAGHTGEVRAVAFSSADRVVSGGMDGTVRIWDLPQHVVDNTLRSPSTENGVYALAVSNDQRLVAAGTDSGAVVVWELPLGTERPMPTQLRHRDGVTTVVFGGDSRLLSAGKDGTVKLWDAAAGTMLRSFENGHRGWVVALAASADGSSIASGGLDGRVVLWSVASDRPGLVRGLPNGGPVEAIALSRDAARLVAGAGSQIVVWDRAAAAPRRIDWREGAVRAMALSPDGDRLAIGASSGAVLVVDAATGRALGQHKGHNGAVNSVAFSPDGVAIASAGSDGNVSVWKP
jgi:WD40 repeat protein